MVKKTGPGQSPRVDLSGANGLLAITPFIAGNRRGQAHLLRFCSVPRHLYPLNSKKASVAWRGFKQLREAAYAYFSIGRALKHHRWWRDSKRTGCGNTRYSDSLIVIIKGFQARKNVGSIDRS
jgi:hypothetical protein